MPPPPLLLPHTPALAQAHACAGSNYELSSCSTWQGSRAWTTRRHAHLPRPPALGPAAPPPPHSPLHPLCGCAQDPEFEAALDAGVDDELPVDAIVSELAEIEAIDAAEYGAMLIPEEADLVVLDQLLESVQAYWASVGIQEDEVPTVGARATLGGGGVGPGAEAGACSPPQVQRPTVSSGPPATIVPPSAAAPLQESPADELDSVNMYDDLEESLVARASAFDEEEEVSSEPFVERVLELSRVTKVSSGGGLLPRTWAVWDADASVCLRGCTCAAVQPAPALARPAFPACSPPLRPAGGQGWQDHGLPRGGGGGQRRRQGGRRSTWFCGPPPIPAFLMRLPACLSASVSPPPPPPAFRAAAAHSRLTAWPGWQPLLQVGVGCQAGREVGTAVKRALVDAKKNLVLVPLVSGRAAAGGGRREAAAGHCDCSCAGPTHCSVPACRRCLLCAARLLQLLCGGRCGAPRVDASPPPAVCCVRAGGCGHHPPPRGVMEQGRGRGHPARQRGYRCHCRQLHQEVSGAP